jgi:LemA protein
MTAIWILIGIVVLLALAFVLVRNSIIGQRNRVDESWSGIDVQLKRRYELVPNLVETVRATLEKVTEARADAMRSQGPRDASRAEGALTAALGELRAVAENYPDLRATENFQQLSRNLAELEDEIQAARRIYNSNVQVYNTRIQMFPNSIVAQAGGFEPRDYFEIEAPAEREAPRVSFTDPSAGTE